MAALLATTLFCSVRPQALSFPPTLHWFCLSVQYFGSMGPSLRDMGAFIQSMVDDFGTSGENLVLV
jgi:hypothetical protein